MNQGLQRYLNDHLAGSESALKLVDHLIKCTDGGTGVGFFKGLRRTIVDDQKLLQQLMQAAGLEPGELLRLAGNVSGTASRLKFKWEDDKLGEFEALEMLALCIQGKRLLWRILDEISDHCPQWEGVNFMKLEKEAVVQRDAVEDLRREAGREILAC